MWQYALPYRSGHCFSLCSQEEYRPPPSETSKSEHVHPQKGANLKYEVIKAYQPSLHTLRSESLTWNI